MPGKLYLFYVRLQSVVQLMRLDGRAIKVLAACFLISNNCFAYQLRVIAPLEINRRQRQNGAANDSQAEKGGREGSRSSKVRGCKAKMRSSGEIKALKLS